MLKKKVAVLISKNLYEKIKRRVELNPSEFKSVEEYVEFVLIEALKGKKKAEPTRSSEEEEKFRERLRDLGYL